MTARASRALALFRVPVFRAMWASAIVSQLGGFIQIVASGWAMVALSSSAAMVALVQTAANLPVMLFAVASGALADIVGRRTIMLTAQLLMLVLSAVLTALAATDSLTAELLLILTFLIGCGTALHIPAWQACVGELVPAEQIPSAVAANILGNNLARSSGPAIGGIVVASFGIPFAFLLNTISYLGLVMVLWRWNAPSVMAVDRPGLGRSIRDGVAFAFGRVQVRRLLGRAILFSLGSAAIWGLMPAVAVARGGGAMLLGMLFACFGIGAMMGAVWSEMIRVRLGSEMVARLGTAALALSLGLLAVGESVSLAIVAHLVAGAGWVSALSTFNISIQLGVPRFLVGRQLAIYQTATFGGLALGSAAWGLVADGAGLPFALAAAAAFLVVAGVGGSRLGLPQPLGQREI